MLNSKAEPACISLVISSTIPVPGRADFVLGLDEWVAVLPASYAQARYVRACGITLEKLASQVFILATGGCVVNGKV